MNRLAPENLPAFYVYNDVPFLVYTRDDERPEAINDIGVVSTQLPEIIFEGELVTKAQYTKLAKQRDEQYKLNGIYKEVLELAESFEGKTEKE